MSRVFGVSAAAMTFVCGISTIAQEKPVSPPKEFQDLMKSNAAIAPVEGTGGTLAQNLAEGAENYEAIVKDAATLKANFARLLALLSEMKIVDALKWAHAGDEAISNIQRFAGDAVWQFGDQGAMTANKREIERAKIALADACRGCHIRHRVYVITTPLRFEIQR